MTIKTIIAMCDSDFDVAAANISKRSKEMDGVNTITPAAIHKWPDAGIPEKHWRVIRSLVDVRLADLHWANEQVRKTRMGRGYRDGRGNAERGKT